MGSSIRIYDNGGKTVDRYTLVVPSIDEPGKLDMYGFNESPFHPQGFGQYSGSYMPMGSYSHLGKLVSLEDLPEQAQRFVTNTLFDYSEVVPEKDKPKYMFSKVRKVSKRKTHTAPSGFGGMR